MNPDEPKIIWTSTVSEQLYTFCRGFLAELSRNGYEVVALSSPGEHLDDLKINDGIRTIAVDMKRRINPIKDCISLIRLIKTFRKEKPYIVHSMTPKAGFLSMIAARICHVPLRIHTFTGLIFPTSTGLKRRLLMLTDALTCACATHVIPESNGVRNDLLNHKITNKPIKVLGNGNIRGVDLNLFNPCNPEVSAKARKLRNPDVFTFIFIGRIVPDKGIHELIEAFTRLNKLMPRTRLLLIGHEEADIDPIHPRTIARIHNNNAILAPGYQKDVRPWLAASDALILPSYREGCPNVVIEAGAMALPAIVTDVNGSREIIIEGKNGTIIPPHDLEALYSAMWRMATDDPWRKSLAGNARQLIASRYEQTYVRQCFKNFLKQIQSRQIKYT